MRRRAAAFGMLCVMVGSSLVAADDPHPSQLVHRPHRPCHRRSPCCPSSSMAAARSAAAPSTRRCGNADEVAARVRARARSRRRAATRGSTSARPPKSRLEATASRKVGKPSELRPDAPWLDQLALPDLPIRWTQATRRLPRVLPRRPARPLDHEELARRAGPLPRPDRHAPAQGEAARGPALRRDDRVVVRPEHAVARRRARPLAVHARGREDLRAAPRSLGRRAQGSVPLDDRADGLLPRSLPAVRRLAHRARRVQRRLRRDAALDRALQHERLLPAVRVRERAAVGDVPGTRRRCSRPRSSDTTARRSASTRSRPPRPRHGTRSRCRCRCRSRSIARAAGVDGGRHQAAQPAPPARPHAAGRGRLHRARARRQEGRCAAPPRRAADRLGRLRCVRRRARRAASRTSRRRTASRSTQLRKLNDVSHESEIEGGTVLVVPRISDEQRTKNRAKAKAKLLGSGIDPKDGEQLIVPIPDKDVRRSPTSSACSIASSRATRSTSRREGVRCRARPSSRTWNATRRTTRTSIPKMVLVAWVAPRLRRRQSTSVALLDETQLVVVTRGSAEHLDLAEAAHRSRAHRVRREGQGEARRHREEVRHGLARSRAHQPHLVRHRAREGRQDHRLPGRRSEALRARRGAVEEDAEGATRQDLRRARGQFCERAEGCACRETVDGASGEGAGQGSRERRDERVRESADESADERAGDGTSDEGHGARERSSHRTPGRLKRAIVPPMIRSALLVSMVAMVACGDDGGDTKMDAAGGGGAVEAVTCPGTADAEVTTADGSFMFMPAATSISVNQTVKFTNSSTHDVAPDAGAGMTDSALSVAKGATKCFKFTAAGTYHIKCNPHDFKGTITVQ